MNTSIKYNFLGTQLTATTVAGGVLLGLLMVFVVVTFPLLLIWCLNTLFGLGIAYTFWTWLAAFALKVLCFSKVQPSN